MSELCVRYDSFKKRLSEIQHPLLWVALIGIVIHLLMMSVSFVYDSNYWAVVTRNIESGEGLYGLEGYYYTPVWGYILGLVSAFQTFFLDLGELAIRVVEALPVETYDGFYMTATITSLSFQYSYKIILMIAELILAYLVYYLIRDITHDEKKSILAFALMFLCPLIMGTTCVNGMPDIFSALFMVLTIILLRKNIPLVAGMCFAMAVLTKFFPVFSFFILIAYILAVNKNDKKAGYRSLILAAIGSFVIVAIVFLPQIMQGDLSSAFSFLIDRTGTDTGTSIYYQIAGAARILLYGIIIVVSAYLGHIMYRGPGEDLDNKLMKYCMIVFALCLLYPPTPQYVVILIPVLVYWIVVDSKKYLTSWKLLIIGGTLMVFVTNGALLLPLGVYSNLFGVDTAMAIFQAFQTQIGPLSIMWILYILSGVIQYLGVLSVLWFVYKDEMEKRGDSDISEDPQKPLEQPTS